MNTMTIEAFRFGELEGAPVPGFVISNPAGLRAKVIASGARLTEMWAPDRNGILGDVVLGFDNIADYVATDTFFGATCGRYGNRIAHGVFELDGRPYQLGLNDGLNHLHGGAGGFDRACSPPRSTGRRRPRTTGRPTRARAIRAISGETFRPSREATKREP